MTAKTRERRRRFYAESFGIATALTESRRGCEHVTFTVGYHNNEPVHLTCNACGLALKRGAWGWYAEHRHIE